MKRSTALSSVGSRGKFQIRQVGNEQINAGFPKLWYARFHSGTRAFYSKWGGVTIFQRVRYGLINWFKRMCVRD